MKRTAKMVAAENVAAQVLERAELVKLRRDNALLYDALERRGWFWDSESGKWIDRKKSTSMFESDDGLPTGTFRLRLMAHPGDMDRLVEIISEALDTYGASIAETSKGYPNRRGPGLRVYMSCKLPDAKDL